MAHGEAASDSQVTRGTTMAVTLILFPVGRTAVMLKLVTDWEGDLWDIPAIPEILTL